MKNSLKNFTLPFLAILFCSCQQNTKTSQQVGPNDIDTAEAHNMVRNFGIPTIPTRTSSGKPAKNTKAIWLDITKLLPILEQINTEGGDGVRIYFGKYKDGHHQDDSQGKNQDYSLQNTIIIVSTHSVKNHHYDYYTNGKVSSSPFELLNNFDDKKGFILTVPQNKGELTPPGDDEGALLLRP